MVSMQGRKVLITGANSGIGLATARNLAARGAELLLVCRDRSRGETALADVARAARDLQPSLYVGDVSSRQAIRQIVDDVGVQHDRIDVLINNAGAVFAKREASVDGIEKTFATNQLAPFMITALVLPMLKHSQSARIVTVASRVHSAAIDFENLQGERSYNPMQAYGRSKLANILFTYELARRLRRGTITANCLAPGLVSSNFGRNSGGLISLIPRVLAWTPLSVSPEEGARTSVYLASSPDVEGNTGGYYYKCRPSRSKPISHDRQVAKRLWRISAELTGIDVEA